MNPRFAALLSVVLLVLIPWTATLAQDTASQATGLPPNGSFSGSNFDNVQLNNGNLHIEIPLYSLPGRGLSVPVKLVYDSKGWYEYTSNPQSDTQVYVYPRGWRTNGGATGQNNMGWTLAAPMVGADGPPGAYPFIGFGLSATSQIYNCPPTGTTSIVTYTYREPNGTSHAFLPVSPANVCGLWAPSSVVATDGSGYTILLNQNSNHTETVVTKDGTQLYATAVQSGVNGYVTEDTNGNQITRGVTSGVPASTITDTLGRNINVALVLNSGTGKYELKYYDSNGSPQTIQFTMTTVNVQTNLCSYQNTGSSGLCNEWQGTWQAPSVIQLPNGMQYNISYVQAQNGQASDGQISSITLPTGATISYTWGVPPAPSDLDDAGPRVKSRTLTSGSQVATWNYTYTGNILSAVNTVTDPLTNDTVHTFQSFTGGSGLPVPTYDKLDQYYQGPTSGNVLLKTVQTVYQSTVFPLHLPLTVTTTWNQQGGLVSEVDTSYYVQNPTAGLYQSWGNITEKDEYAFGTNQTLVRKTDYQYAHISGATGYNVNYLNLGISDRMTEKTVYDGSANKVADSIMAYDGTAVTTTLGVPNHDYSIGTYRGNLTKSSIWRDKPTATWLDTIHTYDDLGHVLSTKNPDLDTTSFSYGDSWSGTGCGLSSLSHTLAFLTESDAPDTVNQQGNTVHHRSQTTYLPCTGQKQSTRDENDILASRTGTTYTYDSMLRPLCVNYTDSGQTCRSYSDTANAVSVTTTEKQDSSHNIVSTRYLDGLGRVKQTQLVDPADGDTFVETTYDLMGRVATVTNPHRSGGLPTDGTTQYQYDALNRKTLEIPPDGTSSANNVMTAYTGSSVGLITTVTDQVGNQRRSYSDALGRLIRVDEPALDGVQPAIKATGSVTFAGTEGSHIIPGQPATPGTGTVTISGNLQWVNLCPPGECKLYDNGTVYIIVNGYTETVSYNRPLKSPCQTTCDAPSIASALASALNGDTHSPVTATVNNTVVTVTSKATGSNTNYTFSASTTYDTTDFFKPSLTATVSGATLTGGKDAIPQQTIWDTGTLSITVNSLNKTQTYGQGSVLATMASQLASDFTNDNTSCVTANSSQGTVTFTARQAGVAGNNCSISATTTSNFPQYFTPPSFTVSSTVAMHGGKDAVQPIDRPAITLESYDTLNNLLSVQQQGYSNNNYRTRTFTYDSLSRLLTAANPESGTTTWTYDNDSNVLTKTDARNVTITYNYDQLNRVATTGSTHAKSYSNGDPAVDYYFDQTSYNGLTIQEGVNQRTGMGDGTGAAAWTFDSEGRPLQEKRKVNISGLTPSPVTNTLTYVYNLDGSAKSVTYPSNHRVDYVYNTAGRALSAIDQTNSQDIKYYVTGAAYAPQGAAASYVNGQNASTGITTTDSWNNRLQPVSFVAATQGTGAHTVMSLTFNFNQGTPTAPIDNGLLVKITNAVNSGRNVNYKYDAVNRIRAAWHDATDWGTEYNADIWGNLYQKSACDNVVCPTRNTFDSFSATANANNQFTGYSYDASGNLQNDQLGHTFSYDGENRPHSAGGVTYYYDGEGERVAKSSGKLYWFGTGSAPVLETDTSGTMTAEYVFFNGKRVAMRDAADAVHDYFADQIGSANVVTDSAGDMPPQQDIEYHPYGEQQVYVDTLGQQYRFTGHEHDTETSNDYFGARYYSSASGRFLTPDWAATPVPVPYAVLGNPQTLNLYSYVENNPITGTDPDGHASDYIGLPGEFYECKTSDTCTGNDASQKAKQPQQAQGPAPQQAQNACQTGSCNVKTVSDTGPTGTPNPLGLGAVERDVTYQAVDPSGKPVQGAEISLHETPLAGKEGGDAKNYNYAANGSSNSQKGEEAAHRAGQFNDVMSTGAKGPAGFRQTYTVEGKPGNIIWPTKNGPVVAPSQKVLIRPDKVVILPEVNQ